MKNHQQISAGIDPVGIVTKDGEHIYREIAPKMVGFFTKLITDERLMEDLFASGLVRTSIHESSSTSLILEHEFIERQTFWNEWSFDMLKDSALLTVRLTLRLLRSGLSLKDAHPYNVLFQGCRPVFVDLGSIVEYSEPLRRSWEQSFISEYLLPLWSVRGGHKSWSRILFRLENRPALKELLGCLGFHIPAWRNHFKQTDSFADALTALEGWLVQLKAKEYATTWVDYYERGTVPEVSKVSTYTNKERAADLFLRRTRVAGCQTLLDVASNEGWFSKLAVNLGYRVVALDYDERAINNLYIKLGVGTVDILPVVMNFAEFNGAHGPKQLWQPAVERLRSDTTLAMALIHHLSLGQKLPFADFAKQLADLTGRFAIVEFIDPTDIHIQRRARKTPWYTEEGFRSAMNVHFLELAQQVSEPCTRKVFLYEKK